MELLQRSAVPVLALRTERVPMASLGAEVIVRGRVLEQTLALFALHASVLTPREGESDAEAKVRAGADLVANTLAHQVVLADDLPMWSAAQWRVHGGAHPDEVMVLHAVAQRMAGAVVEDVEKNSQASPD